MTTYNFARNRFNFPHDSYVLNTIKEQSYLHLITLFSSQIIHHWFFGIKSMNSNTKNPPAYKARRDALNTAAGHIHVQYCAKNCLLDGYAAGRNHAGLCLFLSCNFCSARLCKRYINCKGAFISPLHDISHAGPTVAYCTRLLKKI